ncbi:MAG: MerR family transcriptional regulator [Parafilimonas sp.]|nr:MerR family transcriptional regulator [Parafilimonas sp.]
MQQLDLFNIESGNKVAVIRAKQKAVSENKNEEVIATKLQPGTNKETTIDEALVQKHQPQLIKPLSKKAEQPSKRGRKSLKENNLDVALLDIPEDELLFQKQYYSIREVAEWFNMKPSLLRFWENEFDILKPRKNKKGDRLFRPEDVKNLRIIYYLLRQQKYSVEGAKQFLKDNQKKAEMHVQLAETLTKFRSFLLELKANLGA